MGTFKLFIEKRLEFGHDNLAKTVIGGTVRTKMRKWESLECK